MREVVPYLALVMLLVVFPVTGSAATVQAAPSQEPVVTQQDEPASGNDTELPSSASEFLSVYRSMEDTESYNSFSEFEIIRSQAVLAVQIGNFTDREQRRMEEVYKLLVTFDEAYRHQQSGEYEEAIKWANRTSQVSSSLRQREGGERYAILATVALERFYDQTGQAIQSTAEEETTTPARISMLERAALSYQRAGTTDRYSQILIRVDSIENTFAADAETMNASAAAAADFESECQDCGGIGEAVTGYGLGVFPRYLEARTASQQVGEAIDLAEKHGLQSRTEQLTAFQSDMSSVRMTLAMASGVLIMAYALLLAVIGALIAYRLVIWQQDLESAARGDSVLMGAMLNG